MAATYPTVKIRTRGRGVAVQATRQLRDTGLLDSEYVDVDAIGSVVLVTAREQAHSTYMELLDTLCAHEGVSHVSASMSVRPTESGDGGYCFQLPQPVVNAVDVGKGEKVFVEPVGPETLVVFPTYHTESESDTPFEYLEYPASLSA